ncbi:MAG TPA: peptidoglycan editing factor PgeF [Dissulfurispiraceae bacterium]
MVFPPIFDGLPVKGFFTAKEDGPGREGAAKMLGVPPEAVYLPIQKHTDEVAIISHELTPVIADSIVTAREGLFIGIQVADCVPILLYDRVRRVAGAVHAGWRGTAAGILGKTLRVMAEAFRASASDVLIAVGPSIKGCCYEVGREVIEAVVNVTGEGDYCKGRCGKYHIDLPEANRRQALSSGVPPGNIWISGDCTFCHPDKYHSYRYACRLAKNAAGRQCGFIGIV